MFGQKLKSYEEKVTCISLKALTSVWTRSCPWTTSASVSKRSLIQKKIFRLRFSRDQFNCHCHHGYQIKEKRYVT